MIVGIVTSAREARIPVQVIGADGVQRQLDAVIDTGFDGWLTLPQPLIDELRLTWVTRGRVLLADGSESICDVFATEVVWHTTKKRIVVDSAPSDPLVGMALLEDSEVRIEARPGGRVTIQSLG